MRKSFTNRSGTGDFALLLSEQEKEAGNMVAEQIWLEHVMENQKFTKIYRIRHSAAHLLAQAVMELYPQAQMTIGPVTENGFFYDFYLGDSTFKESDLPTIEEKMHELAKENFKIVGKEVTKEKARKLFANNRFKQELIDGIEGDTVGVWCQGDFCDLCRGGHVNSTGELKFFKLTAVSGAYWRADRSGTPLQRIYVVAFESKKELEEYLKKIEEAKARDHRKIGKELSLFSFSEYAPGFPFFNGHGTVLFNKLVEYMRELQARDYIEVRTPMILSEELWKISGHYDHYKENIYYTKIDGADYCIKPMNCPGGILLYKEKPRSYKELPLRVAEFGLVHRHELSGVLHGLFRVRAFTQDDAHIYCLPSQMEDEIVKVLQMAISLYKGYGFTEISMGLSTRPENSMGSDELWEKATDALRKALERLGIKYLLKEGEGAFYGPKIDINIKDAMEREWQCGTVQVDFFLPQNFKMEYIAPDQSRKQPVMIHRAIYGSLERFIGILTEHYKGWFPFWCSPVQMRILTITDDLSDYAAEVFDSLLDGCGLRGPRLAAEADRSGQGSVPCALRSDLGPTATKIRGRHPGRRFIGMFRASMRGGAEHGGEAIGCTAAANSLPRRFVSPRRAPRRQSRILWVDLPPASRQRHGITWPSGRSYCSRHPDGA